MCPASLKATGTPAGSLEVHCTLTFCLPVTEARALACTDTISNTMLCLIHSRFMLYLIQSNFPEPEDVSGLLGTNALCKAGPYQKHTRIYLTSY